MEVNLNLGCGDFKLDGYINIDCREEVNPDICCRIENLSYEPETVDEIYASHILEHLALQDARVMLGRFHSWLKKSGFLSIVVPNLTIVCGFIADGDTHDALWNWLFGTKSSLMPQRHQWGYTQITLEDELRRAKFSEIESFVPLGGDGWFFHKGQLLSLSLKGIKQ